MQGQDYMVYALTLPNQTLSIFAEWLKIDGRPQRAACVIAVTSRRAGCACCYASVVGDRLGRRGRPDPAPICPRYWLFVTALLARL
ncbi:hypothetical protein EVAR_97596_1 [Eumeta japonica]|uniref:Uncharacterized protein n=1 Tax=Eumeta variegata TaxID=151549 RepID=A0A4C1XMV1_EUMVA|nr:hypothetical protein EVAR_97596_1 [Eumeta japonica]